jgi:uncharacterized hydrophobic protein (TIGR00341 family)
MPLRILEVSVPSGNGKPVEASLAASEAVQVWEPFHGESVCIVRALIDSTDVEEASDALQGQYGHLPGFRMTLLPVEATLPPLDDGPEPEPGSEEAAADGPAKGRKKNRISREELLADIVESSQVNSVYLLMILFSTTVAAVGLLRGDVALIIGAMVIAPLLGPNIGLSLAAALGDDDLVRTSMKAISAGVILAASLSWLLGMVVDVDPSSPQLLARIGPGVGDIAVALAAGGAGALAFTSGVPAVVVGVMVAVALLPPLVTAGLLAGAGYYSQALGAVVLVVTNVACVNLAAMGVFWWQDVRPRTYWEADRSRPRFLRALGAWAILLGILLVLFLTGQIEGLGLAS